MLAVFYLIHWSDQKFFYLSCASIGFTAGYWAIFLIILNESYGTNLRATMTTSIPNFIRAFIIPTTLFLYFLSGYLSFTQSLVIMNSTIMLAAIMSLMFISKTHASDLNFVEVL